MAKVSARFFLGADNLPESEKKQLLRQYYQSLPEEVVQIYDSNNRLIVQEGAERLKIANKTLNLVRSNGSLKFTRNDRQIVAIPYKTGTGTFVVVASSVDVYNLEKMRHLRAILIVGYFVLLVLVVVMGWSYAKEALKPFRKIVQEVEQIHASDLHRRLSYTDGRDEVSELANTFNNMLNRLELAFDMQNTFISNASHELRTPLTAMIGEIEVALLKKRAAEEYEQVLHSILDDATRLANLSNGLLQIAQASFDVAKIKLEPIRFDEVVWHAYEEIQRRRPAARFEIDFKNLPEDEISFMVKGNEPLLFIAMLNVLENAVKFSPPNPVIKIKVKIEKGFVSLHVQDQGLGISESDLKNVFVPFWRADNVRNIVGHGIGLPLTERIMNLHKGNITVTSGKGEGTEVVLKLPQAYLQIPYTS